jgi:hypothetical protein
LETTSGKFQPLSDSVLFAILKHCPASVRKRLAGLDNISAEGSNAFEELSKLCDKMISFGEKTTMNYF